MKRLHTGSKVAFTSTALLLACECAIAQTAAPAAGSAPLPAAGAASEPAARSPASADATQLDVVVVTAQKRPELAKDVPSSITVLDGGSLRRQGADKLEDYVQRVPGLTLNAQSLDQQQLSIRGISTGPGYAPTVAVYLDEAPFGGSTGNGAGGLLTPDVDSIDLDRIEVLKGPQGTLYGASNIGGLVKFVTIAPDPSGFEGSVGTEGDALSHGNAGYALRARVNVPVIQNQLAVLATAYYRREPGFVNDAGRGLENVDRGTVNGGRLAALWQPMGNLQVKLEAIAQDRRTDGFPEVDADPMTLRPTYGDREQRRAADSEFARTRTRQYLLNAVYDIRGVQVTSTTSWSTLNHSSSQDYTQSFGPIAASFGPGFDVADLGFSAADQINQKKFTQEVRASGKAGSMFDWVSGVYYTREYSTTLVQLPTFDALTGTPIALPALLDADTQASYKEYAGFGQATFHATSQLDVIGGLRYAHNAQGNVSISSGGLVGPESTVVGPSSDNSTTFEITPRFKITNDLTAYARVATGYRPGGANGGYGPRLTYDPDKVTNYEIGLKASIPRQRVAVNFALFDVDWKNIQIQEIDGNGLGYTGNGSRARSQGAEAEVAWTPLAGLKLSSAATYTNATLREDIPSGVYGQKGDVLPFSPSWKALGAAEYSFAVLDGKRAFVGASVFYTDRVQAAFASDASSPRVSLPSYTTFDLRSGVVLDNVTVTAYIKNAGDKRGYNGTRPLTLDPAGVVALSVIQPRTFGLVLSADF